MTGFTTVFGSMSIWAGPGTPPALGSLVTQNTNVNDSSYTYLTASPAAITDSTQIVTPYGIAAANSLLQGVFVRGSLQGSPTVLQNGYRFDYLFISGADARLRWIKFTAGVPTVVASDNTMFGNATYNYYTTNGNTGVSFNVSITGNSMSGFLSASGQPNSPTVNYTDSSGSPHTTGRIGFLGFSNSGGVTLPVSWSAYQATWTT